MEVTKSHFPTTSADINKTTDIISEEPSESNLALIISCVVLVVILVLAIIIIIIAFIRLHLSLHNNANTDLNLEINEFHRKDESDTEENETDGSILPDWLSSRPEMIYPLNSIEKGKMLGHGNYGIVVKGTLTQGCAV
jgi:hypothetical protein